jgi:hypothetical protein
MDPRYINQVKGEIGHYYRPGKNEREMKNQGKETARDREGPRLGSSSTI